MSDNNGELTFKKAVSVIKGYDIPVTELEEYCEAMVYLESIIVDVIESMEWMIIQLKWKHRSQVDMEDAVNYPDSVINWSPDLIKAMEVLERLKHG